MNCFQTIHRLLQQLTIVNFDQVKSNQSVTTVMGYWYKEKEDKREREQEKEKEEQD